MPHTRPWKIALWLSAGLVIVPPVLGMLGTQLGMFRAFSKLEAAGGKDPQALAADISLALNTTAGGLTLALIGLIGLGISLFGLNRAKRRS